MPLQDVKKKVRAAMAVLGVLAAVVVVVGFGSRAVEPTPMTESVASLGQPQSLLEAEPQSAQRAGSPNVARAALGGLEMTSEGCMMAVDTDTGVGPFKVIDRVDTASICCANCSATENCIAWSFHEKTNSCHLKRAQGAKVRSTGVIYGLPAASGVKCKMEFDHDSTAEPYKVINGDDAGKCCSVCTSEKRCVQWSFNKGQKKCRLKDHEGQKLPKKDVVLGRADITLSGCTVQTDIDTEDKPFQHLLGIEFQDTCCHRCQSTKGCEAWTFNIVRQTCNLKRGTGKAFKAPGVVTGRPTLSHTGCMLQYGKDTDSQPYKVLTKMEKLDDCCAQCAQDERCLVWSFNHHEQMCYLKSAHGSRIPNPNVTMGVPEMTTSGCIVSVDSDSDAAPYRQLERVSTADQCCYQCGSEAQCMAWSFDSKRHTCQLRASKGNKIARGGFLLGYPGFRKGSPENPQQKPEDDPRDKTWKRPAPKAYSQEPLGRRSSTNAREPTYNDGSRYSPWRRQEEPRQPMPHENKYKSQRPIESSMRASWMSTPIGAGDENVITVGNGAKVHVTGGGQLFVGPQAAVDVGGQATVNVRGHSQMHVVGSAQVRADGSAHVYVKRDNVNMHGQARLNIQGESPVSVEGPGARVSVAGTANVEARGSRVHVHHDSAYINADYYQPTQRYAPDTLQSGNRGRRQYYE